MYMNQCYIIMSMKNTLSSTGDRPTMPDLLLLEVPERIGAAYFTFGVLLLNDKTGRKMDIIRHVCRHSDDIRYMILQKWLEGYGRPVTWKTLVKTLQDCELFSLAAEIKAKKIDGMAKYQSL